MPDCPRISACRFFSSPENDPGKREVRNGFMILFCKGDLQADCVRNKLCDLFGSSNRVPANMMPNGMALPGTSDEDWPDEVKSAL